MAATIDKDLTSALKAARGGKVMRFAFLPKGGEGKLLVAKKIPPQQIADTKKATGASSVFKGRCVGEDGTLVFEVAKEPPGTLLGQLKKRLKEDAGLTCPVEIRVNPDAEAEPAEEEVEVTGVAPAAPGAPQSPTAVDLDRSAVLKRLNALRGALSAAMARKDARIAALAVAVNGAIKNQDMAQAARVLDDLEALLAQASPAGGTEAQTMAPDLQAQFKERFQTVMPKYQDALKDNPHAQGALAPLAAQVAAAARTADFARALEQLGQLEQALQQVAPPTTPDGDVDARENWEAAWKEVGDQIAALQQHLLSTGDPLMRRIAEFGLTGVTRRLQVGLQVALIEYDRAAGTPRAKEQQKLLDAIDGYKQLLATDEAIALCDTNPYGVKVTVRKTLGAALAVLDKSVRTSA